MRVEKNARYRFSYCESGRILRWGGLWSGPVTQPDAQARLQEIQDRLLSVEQKLLDAANRAAAAGKIRAKIVSQLENVKQLLDAIEAQRH